MKYYFNLWFKWIYLSFTYWVQVNQWKGWKCAICLQDLLLLLHHIKCTLIQKCNMKYMHSTWIKKFDLKGMSNDIDLKIEICFSWKKQGLKDINVCYICSIMLRCITDLQFKRRTHLIYGIIFVLILSVGNISILS